MIPTFLILKLSASGTRFWIPIFLLWLILLPLFLLFSPFFWLACLVGEVSPLYATETLVSLLFACRGTLIEINGSRTDISIQVI